MSRRLLAVAQAASSLIAGLIGNPRLRLNRPTRSADVKLCRSWKMNGVRSINGKEKAGPLFGS
jgi:hypothetical protein